MDSLGSHDDIMAVMQARYGKRLQDFLVPPPVFLEMQGEFLEFDLENATLTVRFPVLEKFLNPYRTLQGGMLAAAVDNTLGPLSMAVAPPNVTRTLEMKYSKPVTVDMGYIIVTGKLEQRSEPRLFFTAVVRSQAGEKLATCKALHWVIGNPQTP
jgi:acyl-coenzyme A thioesterase PaaI-like protein